MSEEGNMLDSDSEELAQAMLTAARSVVRTCMQIRSVESVLVITDPKFAEVGRALYEASAEVTERILLMMMPASLREGSEPPNQVADLMRRQDVILIATQFSMTHTRARANASREGARIASMPGIDALIFASGGMTADYNALQKEISGINKLLRRRREVVITSEVGTNLTFTTGGRWILEDNGICNRPGVITNLPAGKIFVLPKEGTAHGRIVIDGSWQGKLVDEPISILVEKGQIVDIVGGDLADQINSKIEATKTGLRQSEAALVGTFAEFGFGMNPRAKLSGNYLEDLVYRGGAYFGFGNNLALGGTASVPLNLRGVARKLSVQLEDVDLLVEGKVTLKVK